MIGAALVAEEPHLIAVAHQAQRLARNAQANFDLGADGHEFDERSENVNQKIAALVAAVEADLLPEPAGRDADSNRRVGGRWSFGGSHWRMATLRGNQTSECG